jgi:hypothetical protein
MEHAMAMQRSRRDSVVATGAVTVNGRPARQCKRGE